LDQRPNTGTGSKEFQMDSIDQPGQPAIGQPIVEPGGLPPQPAVSRPSGFRRTILTAGMAAALLIAGGVAVVSAASPDPSASPTPAATTDPSTDDSTTPESAGASGERGDCPADDADTSATPSSAT
jgi:hypothetical protein